MTDVHIGPDRPTEAERAAIDRVVAASLGPAVVVESERLVRGGIGRRNERRHLLLPALHALQNAGRLDLARWAQPRGRGAGRPPGRGLRGRHLLRPVPGRRPRPRPDVVHVCVDAACQIAGLRPTGWPSWRPTGIPAQASPCLGQCERPVAVFIQGRGRPDRVPEPGPDAGGVARPAAGPARSPGRPGRAPPPAPHRPGRWPGRPDQPRRLCRRRRLLGPGRRLHPRARPGWSTRSWPPG